MTTTKRTTLKRSAVSLAMKLDIIRALEENGNQTQIAQQFHISRPTVNRIWRNRDEILPLSTSANLSRKRKRESKESDVGDALYMWFKRQLTQGERVSGPLLKEKAQQLAADLGHNFIPSEGWLSRFKSRHNIAFKREHREKQAAEAAAIEWRTGILPYLLANFSPDDIFSVGETGVYFRCVGPDSGTTFKCEFLHGSKKGKDRVTVVVCANMSGSEKRPLLVIGKSSKSKSFPQDVDKLPVLYRHSTNAFLTSTLFVEHLNCWDKQLHLLNRKIALLLDICSSHPRDIQLENIHLVFLPANTTTEVQPMYMGIIRNLKGFYRSALNCRISAELNANSSLKSIDVAKKITLLDALYLLTNSWDRVKRETIVSCFSKAGIVTPNCSTVEMFDDLHDVPIPKHLTAEQFQVHVDIDHDLQTSGDPIHGGEMMIGIVKVEGHQEMTVPSNHEESDSDQENNTKPSSTTDVLTALNVIRAFVQRQGLSHSDSFATIEAEVMNFISKN